MNKLAFAVGTLWLFAATAALGAVNINSASAAELQSLDGIGQVKAQAIVDYRENNGNFENKSELEHVNGIGSATMSDVSGDVTVGSD